MAKVRMLRNPAASYGCSLMEGQTGELDQTLADQLVGLGLAVSLDSPKVIKAIPEPPQMVAITPEGEVPKTDEAKPPVTHRRTSAKL